MQYTRLFMYKPHTVFQVIVKNLADGSQIMLKSFYGYEIDEVKIMGNDKYLIAHTSDTMMVGDLINNKISEVGV